MKKIYTNAPHASSKTFAAIATLLVATVLTLITYTAQAQTVSCTNAPGGNAVTIGVIINRTNNTIELTGAAPAGAVDILFQGSIINAIPTSGSFSVTSATPSLVPRVYTLPLVQNGGNLTIIFSNSVIGDMSTCVVSFTPLEVSLTSLEAQKSRAGTLVAWATASETNNAGFDIERSTDGTSFEKIGYLKGAGTTTTAHAYKFIDTRPAAGTNYYRLRQIDHDGKFEYSKIVSAAYATDGLQVYPNPATDAINIVAAVGSVLYLHNALGAVVHTQTTTQANTLLSVSQYPKGIYLLRAGTQTTRFVVE
jgi:hypothetical protein